MSTRTYRPSDIYSVSEREMRKFVRSYSTLWKVRGFAIPKFGDHYIAGVDNARNGPSFTEDQELSPGTPVIFIACDGWMPPTPRLIVEMRTAIGS